MKLARVFVWLVVLIAVAGLWRLGRDLTDRPLVTPSATVRSEPAVGVSPGSSGDGWKVVRQMSAHYMLVLEVETERVPEADRIARQLTEPVKDRYTEVMVYVFRPGRRGGLPAARVQWTHRGGYEVTEYGQN